MTCLYVPSGGKRFQPPDLADSEARRIADGDLRLVEVDPAVDRVELAQRGAVQVDLADGIRLGHRHVHSGRHADASFDHAADHALDPVQRGDVGDPDGVGDAAGLHQLDVDDVRGLLAQQV